MIATHVRRALGPLTKLIDFAGDEDACWRWLGDVVDGYPVDGSTLARELVWERYFRKAVAAGRHLEPICRSEAQVNLCVHPEHQRSVADAQASATSPVEVPTAPADEPTTAPPQLQTVLLGLKVRGNPLKAAEARARETLPAGLALYRLVPINGEWVAHCRPVPATDWAYVDLATGEVEQSGAVAPPVLREQLPATGFMTRRVCLTDRQESPDEKKARKRREKADRKRFVHALERHEGRPVAPSRNPGPHTRGDLASVEKAIKRERWRRQMEGLPPVRYFDARAALVEPDAFWDVVEAAEPVPVESLDQALLEFDEPDDLPSHLLRELNAPL